MKSAAAVLVLLAGLAAGARAADVHVGQLEGDVLQVDFAPSEIADADVSTVTVVNSSGSAVLALSRLDQHCEDSCTDSGRACYFVATYRASGAAAAWPSSLVLMGARAVTGVHPVTMRRSNLTPEQVVRVWQSSAPEDGTRIEYVAGLPAVNGGFEGRWSWDPDSQEAAFSSTRAPDVILRGGRLQSCPVFVSHAFESLGCVVDQGGKGVVSSWLYYKRKLVLWYGCEDCKVPHLRVTARFQLDGETHYLLTDSRGTNWLLKRFGDSFVVLEGPGNLLPACAQQ